MSMGGKIEEVRQELTETRAAVTAAIEEIVRLRDLLVNREDVDKVLQEVIDGLNGVQASLGGAVAPPAPPAE